MSAVTNLHGKEMMPRTPDNLEVRMLRGAGHCAPRVRARARLHQKAEGCVNVAEESR